MNLDNFSRTPGYFEIFGVDILIDSDLKTWFIEIVDNPGIHDDTVLKHELFTSLITSLM